MLYLIIKDTDILWNHLYDFLQEFDSTEESLIIENTIFLREDLVEKYKKIARKCCDEMYTVFSNIAMHTEDIFRLIIVKDELLFSPKMPTEKYVQTFKDWIRLGNCIFHGFVKVYNTRKRGNVYCLDLEVTKVKKESNTIYKKKVGDLITLCENWYKMMDLYNIRSPIIEGVSHKNYSVLFYYDKKLNKPYK